MQAAETQMAEPGYLPVNSAQPANARRHPSKKQSYCQRVCRGKVTFMQSLSFRFRVAAIFALLVLFCLTALPARSQDLHLPLPKKSKYTPVQQLNRDGVQAIKKHNIEKAKRLFYKAYLIDPNDPFTLNNLGYVAELEGEVDRAHRYYDQAQAGTSEAVVDRSTEDTAQGKKVSDIAGRTQEGPLKVNEMNGEAITLLAKDRAPEADVILQQALRMDSKNPFTLNNLAFARENEGELEQALRYYNDAARSGKRRGKTSSRPISWIHRILSPSTIWATLRNWKAI